MTKSTQTETPRTLAKLGALVAAKLPWSVAFTDMQAHAEQLETELAASAAEVERLKEAGNDLLHAIHPLLLTHAHLYPVATAAKLRALTAPPSEEQGKRHVLASCEFVGEPPAGYVSWHDWAASMPLSGVRIQALDHPTATPDR